MKVLFDTNVILDVLLDRKPFSEQSSYLLSKVERSEISGFLCATTVTTIHYLLTKQLGREKSVSSMGLLLSLFEVAPVNKAVLENALKADFADFEDAVLHESAIHAGAECLVTRNSGDFKKAKLRAYSPEEMLTMLESLE